MRVVFAMLNSKGGVSKKNPLDTGFRVIGFAHYYVGMNV
jgi:hypothetical protein